MKYGEVVRDLGMHGVTGDFTTRISGDFTTRISGNFAFYVKPIPLKCLGVPPIGNFGSVHRISIIRIIRKINLCNNSTSSVVPRGFCRRFPRGNDCPGCNFKHQCFKCGVVHPATWCNFRSSRPALHSTQCADKSRTANPS